MSFFRSNDNGSSKDYGHPSQGHGFGAVPDPFAGISQDRGQDDDDAIDFDDTYDGLGDQLDEDDDDLNEDTFGSGEGAPKKVGKDFDFYGSTSKVSNAINEEAVRLNHRQPPSKSTFAPASPPKQTVKPFKTGYEAYKNPGYKPDLQVDASLWGTGPSQSTSGPTALQQQASSNVNAKKMMSLEEVEAALRSHTKRPNPTTPPDQHTQATALSESSQQRNQPAPNARLQQQNSLPQSQAMYQPFNQSYYNSISQHDDPQPTKTAQRPIQYQSQHSSRPSQIRAELPTQTSPAQKAPLAPRPATPPERFQREHHAPSQSLTSQTQSPQPRQILQNPSRQSAQLASLPVSPPVPAQMHVRGLPGQNGSSVPLPVIYHPSQIINLSEDERKAYLVEEAKRAKRNHKIFMLSKGNGLMTPQDKNFITRIQLQQLMTATGNVNEQDPDASLSEDFYYQVYNQIENRPRQNSHQPLSNFAQTYLFRTGGRQGGFGRRQRGGDSHMQRMEQQVQRAVEAAKAKPKNKQLVIEGSLGKISFSNAKTPKPLLNIKRNDSSDIRPGSRKSAQSTLSTTDRKAILKNIEAVYSNLMQLEDHERHLPPQPSNESDQSAIQKILDWQEAFSDLNSKLWHNLKVTEPIMSESATLHPFIAFLSYPKGKKAIPRVFNHINENQRLTILTMIIIHLDILDVVRFPQPQTDGAQPSLTTREQIDLFLQVVMPSLFAIVTDLPLNNVIGALDLILERVNLLTIVRTRVGLEVLTMLLSRAAIVKATEGPDNQTWAQWLATYNRFFDMVEPFLGEIFPNAVNAGQDQYVWQFLAATGSGANPDQQQKLVLAVKDRVMETIQQSKTLPLEVAARRRGNVNLFMQAIGLDVDWLDS